ncbi:ATP-grasp domain-containing protein [Nitratidesulfovibrio sp.]|uniref:ATP-grasp domain-containing protein n=1 Tax=Nitratidesulfovibrio sp. TaxID=2802297 RepID=UPI00333E74D5
MSTVLVLSADTMLARVIAKNLHGHGYGVLAADCVQNQICSYSKYVSKTFVHADHKTDEQAFIDDVMRICIDNGVDILMPVLGEAAPISRSRGELERHVSMLVGDAEALQVFSNKYHTYELARGAGLKVPEYWAVERLAAETSLADEVTYPSLAKPVWGWGGYGMTEFTNATALRTFIAGMEPRQRADYFVQRRMSGDVVCVAMICAGGKAHAWDSYRIVATYPSRYGQSTVRETVCSDAAVDALKALLAYVEWTGVCQADFIVEPDTGDAYLIDVNARYWNSLVQSTARGIDFPYYYCLLSQGRMNFTVLPRSYSVTTAWLSRAVRGSLPLVMRRTAMGMLSGEREQAIVECDDWDIHDPLPFFAWPIRSVCRKVMQALPESMRRYTRSL